jgi:hypothetical protein
MKQKAPLVWRTGLSGVPPDSVRCTRVDQLNLATFGFLDMPLRYNSPDCPVCHWTVSGAPGWINSILPPSDFWKCHSAIIHRTVRCSTGLSGVPCGATTSAPTIVCKSNSEQCASARAESEQVLEGTPDSEQ